MNDSTQVIPNTLDIYIKYERLTVRSLTDLCSGIAELADIVLDFYGNVTGSLPNQLPAIEIEEAHTGESIKIKFGEGWLPSVSSNEDDDIVIDVPKKLGIPLLLGYLLLNGVKATINMHSTYLDNQIKQVELQLKKNELQDKLSKSKKSSEVLQKKAVNVVNTIIQNNDYRSFVIYDIDILTLRHDNNHNCSDSEDDETTKR